MPMLASKRQKLSDHVYDKPGSDGDVPDLSEERREDDSSSEELSGSESDGNSADTADETVDAKRIKSKKTSKRKIRATKTSQFGSTLQSLLNTDAPSTLPLSLKPSIARKRNDERLELKAKKVLQVEKKEKEDKARIRDVIGGWGGEGERALRKVAQRGVVKLFNAIQQSQTAASDHVEESKAMRGTGKPSLPAKVVDNNPRGKGKGRNKNNVIGRGKETGVDQDDFFDMIRSGGIVSKV